MTTGLCERSDWVESAEFARLLFRWAESHEWASYDPFDLLLSPVIASVSRHFSLLARAGVQAGKRLGARPRRWLGIQPHLEAKAISDYLSAAVILDKCGVEWANSYLGPLENSLGNLAIATRNGYGWGLEFPYTSRFVSVRARTPNLYQTLNAIQALLDSYARRTRVEALDLAQRGGSFILNDLGHFTRAGSLWFRYWPADETPIVNVQALAAGLFARLGTVLSDRSWLNLADQAAATILAQQRSDGSWRYSEDGRGDFVDGFHTGFVLQGLAQYCQYRASQGLAAAHGAIQTGLGYFKNHLVTTDGWPRYFADGRTSTDGQNFAQCVQTLALCERNLENEQLGWHVWQRMRSRLATADIMDSPVKFFRASSFTSLRWTLGPAALATAHLLNSSQETAVD